MAFNPTTPLKNNTTEGYETDFDPNNDALNVRGVQIQGDSGSDTAVRITRDVSNNLVFVDPLAGTKTLSSLGGGGGGLNTGSAVVDFGVTPSDLVVATVTGQTWVTNSNPISVVIEAFSPDHDPEDVVLEGLSYTIGNRVVGVGFDIIVAAPWSTWGQYTCRFYG